MSNGFPGRRYLPVGFSVSPLLDKIKDNRAFCIINSDTSAAVKAMVGPRNVNLALIAPLLKILSSFLESTGTLATAPALSILRTTGQFLSRAARKFSRTQKGLSKRMAKTLQFGLSELASMISLLIMYVENFVFNLENFRPGAHRT